MATVLFMLAVVCTPLGLALGAVGVVLRLCEWSWATPSGSLGSWGFLRCGALLCVPAVVFFLG